MADKSRRIHEAALGWLEIEISGEFTERLLNLALQNGLELKQIQRLGNHRLRCRLLLQEVYALRPLLSATRCKIKIIKRGGRPFWLYRARRRIGLIAGSILFALALYIMCSFVWRVEVQSLYPIDAEERERILSLARAAGLQPGAWLPGLDWQGISNYILTEAGDLIYTYTEQQGVTALIHIVRRIDAGREEQALPPGDIIAERDGLIEQILVRSGTAAVSPGDTVKAGDVLVYGFGGGQLTAASALIEARIWSQREAAWPLEEQGFRPSGRQAASMWLCFSKGRVLLSGQKQPAFSHSIHKEQVYKVHLWRNITLPVEIILDTWYEQQPYATSYSWEEAYNHARRQAEGLALAALPGDCDLTKQSVIELPPEDNRVRVQVIYEATGDIGSFMPLDDIRRSMYTQLMMDKEQTP